MPVRAGKEAIYEAADLFRRRCLSEGRSLLWPDARAWTSTNLASLWDAFIVKADTGERTFFEKWRDQLVGLPADVQKVACDVLAFYYVFPARITKDKKIANLDEVLGWTPDRASADLIAIIKAFEAGGIGHGGRSYQTNIPWQLGFFIRFAQYAAADGIDLDNASACKAVADRAKREVQSSAGARNVLLHLLFPTTFQRIASDADRKSIVDALGNLVPQLPQDTDDALEAIRQTLAAAAGRPDLDFYDPDVKQRWKPETRDDEVEDEDDDNPAYWIEKTIVDGRSDREKGDYALGAALWSPEKDKRGGDIYRFMRDVKPDDIVLHLTDNNGFTGVSRAARGFEKFNGVPNTAWGEGPSYLVRLSDFRRLEPILSRDVFFGSPYRKQLLELISQGKRPLFYNKDGDLNQGHYITPAPKELVSILDEAYRGIAGRGLLDGRTDVSPVRVNKPSVRVGSRLDLAGVAESFTHALHDSGVIFGSHHAEVVRSFVASLATKRFVILTGLSGSGKTQLALRFGEWLGNSFPVAVRPDWTGAEALFGYPDALQPALDGRLAWNVPDALAFMLHASERPDEPHLLLLDEMNLAHVERYFADVLSGMESEYPCLPNLGKGSDGRWRTKPGGASHVILPKNLLVVGTVNVDETTYMFSPKVLDRANTFEFRVTTDSLSEEHRKPEPCEPGAPELVRGFLAIASDDRWHLDNPAPGLANFKGELLRIHTLLSEAGFEFGHRVFYEAVRFAAMLSAAGDADPMHALDYQILQKVLPRVHGSRRRIESVLAALARFCFDLSFDEGSARGDRTPQFDPLEHLVPDARLRSSFDKVRRMMLNLRVNQFTSFTE
jgi:MoxR-like ATPase